MAVRPDRYARLAVPSLLLAALVGGLLLVSPGLRRDYSLQAFVAGGEGAYAEFKAFVEEFGSNELAMIAVRTDDALSDASLALVGDLTEKATNLEAVEQASSITRIPPAVRAALGDGIRRHPLIEGNLLSADGTTAAIVLHMRDEHGGGARRRATVGALRDIVRAARLANPGAEFHLAGPYVTLIDMYDYVDHDLLVFSAAALGLIVLSIGLVFRRARAMLYLAGSALGATLLALGLAAVLNLNASLIVQMVVILIFVLTAATGVQLLVRGEEIAGRVPFPPGLLAVSTLLILARPCVAVVMTTMVGFGSVSISNITPVRVFGGLMAFGLAVGLLLTFVGLPLGLCGLHPGETPRGAAIDARLRRAGGWTLRHPRTVALFFAAACVLSAAGLPRLRFESDFVKNFREDSEVRRAYRFIEEHLTPLGSVEIVVRAPVGGSMLTPERLAQARTLAERALSENPAIRKAMTLSDLLTLDGADPPGSTLALRMRMEVARQLLGAEMLRAFVSADGSALRINLRAIEGYAVGEKLAMATRIEQAGREVFGEGCSVKVTGLYHFYARLVDGLIRDQYTSFLLTVPLVFLVISLSLRSAKSAVIVMIPNLIPVLVCVGAMAWLAIPVNMTTVMMLSVTFGIAVDNSIHYVWRYRAELATRNDPESAVVATHATVGRACVFTTVVVAGGFWILVLSRFLPTAYFGGLIGFTMIWALLAGLLLLPVLLVRLSRQNPWAREEEPQRAQSGDAEGAERNRSG